LRAIAGLDPQDDGLIEIAGRDVSHLPPAARDFGIVFQSYALFPNLTVAANVGYGLVTAAPARRDDARVAELLTLVGMPEQGVKYPVQLSGGQQQPSRSRARLRPRPDCCCSTSRSPRSMRGCGCGCATRSSCCSGGSA